MMQSPPQKHRLEINCPAAPVLVQYSIGLLDQGDTTLVAAHLENCHNCLSTLQTLDQETDLLVTELRDNIRATPEPDFDDSWITEGIASLCRDTPVPSAQPFGSTERRPAPVAKLPADRPMPRQVGSYELLELLGEGGMGQVFKARHIHLNKIVALKLLPADRLTDPDALARFIQEIKAVGNLQHRNIVQAYDAEVSGVPYLAMELIEGVDLARYLKLRGHLQVADACECVRQAALGLQHAHESGLVHRDIKPSNLMLTPDGVVKLLDLGLARLSDIPTTNTAEVANGDDLTRVGDVVGTVDYIAPEQLRSCRAVDIRADLYSLGCTLYHLLACQPPFAMPGFTSTAKQHAHLRQRAQDIRHFRGDVPPELALVIDQLLAKDPAHRFPVPAALVAALEPFSAGHRLPELIGPAVRAEVPVKRPTPRPSRAAVPGLTPVHPVSEPVPNLDPTGAALGPWRTGLLVFVVTTLFVGVMWALKNKMVDTGDDTHPDGGANSGLIESLDVEQIRTNERGQTTTGRLTAGAPRTRDDQLRIVARLREPVYCYLIVYQPDGGEVVCYPTTPDQVSRPQQSLVYPPEGYFGVSNPGLYTLVLVASPRPLPDYGTWRAGTPKTLVAPGDADGMWKFNDAEVASLQGNTGKVGPKPPLFLTDLCALLDRLPAGATYQGLAFSVR